MSLDDAPQIISFEQFEAETLALIKPPFRSAFGARWFHEISGRKPVRNWLVKGLILAGTFGVVFGPPGSGKSFLSTDLMLSCSAFGLEAQQQTWFRHKLRRFGVVYVIAEGADDFEIRLHAWRIENNIPADTILPFVFLPTGIDMRSSDADTIKLSEEIKALSAIMLEKTGVEVGAVVIDTVARALAGGNENASDVMGAFVINCGKLQAATGACVIGVHHGGKEAGRGPRGHEGLHGAADFEIEVVGANGGEPNAWTIRKLKAGPAGATHRFRLKPISLTKDDEGDEVVSCVVIDTEAQSAVQNAAEPAGKKKGFKLRVGEIEFLQCFAIALEKHGIMPPPGLDVSENVTLVAPVADVKSVFRERLSVTEADDDEQRVEAKLRQRWSRATKGLLQYRIIGTNKVYVWMTGKPVQGAPIKGAIEWGTFGTSSEPTDPALEPDPDPIHENPGEAHEA